MRPQSAKTRRLTAEWKALTSPGSNKRPGDHVAYFEVLSNGLTEQNSERRRSISSAPARRSPPKRVHRKISSARRARTPDEDLGSGILENFLNQRNKGWGERTRKSASKQRKYMYRLAQRPAWSEDAMHGSQLTEFQRSEIRKSSGALRLKQKATSERLSSWKSERVKMREKKERKDREQTEKRAAQVKAATERRLASSKDKDDDPTNRKSAGYPYSRWYSYKTERAKEVQKQKTREEERVARKLAKVRALTNMKKGPPHPQSEADLSALRQAQALLRRRVEKYHSAAQFFEGFGASRETTFSRGNLRKIFVKIPFKKGYLIWLVELIFHKVETKEPGNMSFQDFSSALKRYAIPVVIPSAMEEGADKGPSGDESCKTQSDNKGNAVVKSDGHHGHNYCQYFQQQATSHQLAFYKTERMKILEERKRKEERKQKKEAGRRSNSLNQRPKFKVVLTKKGGGTFQSIAARTASINEARPSHSRPKHVKTVAPDAPKAKVVSPHESMTATSPCDKLPLTQTRRHGQTDTCIHDM